MAITNQRKQMVGPNHNLMRLQTNAISPEPNQLEIDAMSRSVALYRKDGKYNSQNFFTPPRIGEVNWLEGFETAADVYIRSISLKGSNLFHVRLIGSEAEVRKVCADASFFNLLRGISHTFSQESRAKRLIDITTDRDRWDAIASLDKNKCYLANYAEMNDSVMRIENVVVVADQLFGLTKDGMAVQGQLTPHMMETDGAVLQVAPVEHLNALGKIDLIAHIPNSESSLLVCVKNNIYQCTIWGDVFRFETLDDRVKRIKSIDFNRVRSLLATNDGLFEIEVEEMPNMVRPTALPRLISHPELRASFKFGHYVEDPYILGIHPAVGILAKTETQKVACF